MEEFRNSSWIDRRTRALTVEFAVFNPMVNLFVYARLLFEFPASSGVLVSVWMQPMKLLRYEDGYGLLLLIGEISMYIYLALSVIKEIRNGVKSGVRKYFTQFWNWVEICIILLIASTVAIYVVIRVKTDEILHKFEASQGNSYISLAECAQWDYVYNTLLAFVMFLAIFKFLKLLRFSSRVAMLNAIFKAFQVNLLGYSLVFCVLLAAFCSGFYLSMSSSVFAVSTVSRSFFNAFAMILGKYNFDEMVQANYLLAPVFSFLFSMSVVFVLLNVCITLLAAVMDKVRLDSSCHEMDYAVVEHLYDKLKIFFGARRRFDKLAIEDWRKDFSIFDDLDERFELMLKKLNVCIFDENERRSTIDGETKSD